eukprot:CAMPEP_0179061966 /NCGR_PEP_ID=MMETSP0796-20121207/26688_1 /TAXON_ID=73915 /ORGANISM="Pyrodinium bahamense, Strain pbaha01" /LENGTH=373 /DNA_ID=CAMNT_0020758865 /DNA_START=196 /DNA_END=1318 /DNA_ORIENTATION=+
MQQAGRLAKKPIGGPSVILHSIVVGMTEDSCARAQQKSMCPTLMDYQGLESLWMHYCSLTALKRMQSTALMHGTEQHGWGLCTGRTRLGPQHCCLDLPNSVHTAGASARAGRCEQGQHAGASLLVRVLQRRLALPRGSQRVGAALQELPGHGSVAVLACVVQGRLPAPPEGARVDVGTVLQQQGDNAAVALLGRAVERREAQVVQPVRVLAFRQQSLDLLGLAPVCKPHELWHLASQLRRLGALHGCITALPPATTGASSLGCAASTATAAHSLAASSVAMRAQSASSRSAALLPPKTRKAGPHAPSARTMRASPSVPSATASQAAASRARAACALTCHFGVCVPGCARNGSTRMSDADAIGNAGPATCTIGK